MYYIYDQITQEFLYETEGQPNPRVEDEFLKPPFSTEVEPMDNQINKKQVWNGSAWGLVDDYRGQSYWYKATAVQVEFNLGDAVDDTMTDLEPGLNEIWDEGSTAWVADPEYAREQKHDELRAAAIAASEEPVLAIGFMWNSSEESRDRMSAKASHMESMGIAESESWDIDNTMHTVSVVDVREISNAITDNIENVGHHYRTKKNEYLACGDNVTCINAVIW